MFELLFPDLEIYITNLNSEYQAESIDSIPSGTRTISKYEDCSKGAQLIQRTLTKRVF